MWRLRLYLLPGCGAVGQRVAQPMRLWCCSLLCRGALLLRSPIDLATVATLGICALPSNKNPA